MNLNGDAPRTSYERYLPDGWIVPLINDSNAAFFTSGALMLQRCVRCGAVQHPPGELCFSCRSFDLKYEEARPMGTVVARTIVHHAVHPLLEEAVPYNVVVVELDDNPGVRVTGNVVGIPLREVQIGMQVEGCWAKIASGSSGSEDLALLQWSPGAASEEASR